MYVCLCLSCRARVASPPKKVHLIISQFFLREGVVARCKGSGFCLVSCQQS